MVFGFKGTQIPDEETNVRGTPCTENSAIGVRIGYVGKTTLVYRESHLQRNYPTDSFLHADTGSDDFSL